MLHDYYRQGADAQRTCANRQAYRRRTLWPRVLADVGNVDRALRGYQSPTR
jgi:hypothetical protein